jgi:hypothetical protein
MRIVQCPFGARLQAQPVREDMPQAGAWVRLLAGDRVSHRAALEWLLSILGRRHGRWRRYAPPDASPAWWVSARGLALLQAAAEKEAS